MAAAHSGTESVTTTSLIADLQIRSTAGPESTGCVQAANTSVAPRILCGVSIAPNIQAMLAWRV